MDTSPPTPKTSTSFDSTATFEPAISPGSVVLTGAVSNAATVAGMEFYDNGNDLGGISGFQPGSQNWVFQATLQPGQHDITAVVTELSGATYQVLSPYVLVTGIKNQPYVYQELDENAQGVVTSVSDYDGGGNLVSQSSVAVDGSGAAPLTVAFDPTSTFVGSNEALLTGTNTSYGAVSSIEIFDGALSSVINPATGGVSASAVPLGYATVNPNGTWSFDANLAAGQHRFTAVATGVDGQTTLAQSTFTLNTGVVGDPYVYQEIDHGANGGIAAVTSYAADGTVVSQTNQGGATVNGNGSSGEVLRSASNDVMTGDGSGATTFFFTHGFGQDEVTNFNYLAANQSPSGVEHDFLSLPSAVFKSFAQVMKHTTTALDGSAVIHVDRYDTVKLDGVTKADLITHPNVLRFHA